MGDKVRSRCEPSVDVEAPRPRAPRLRNHTSEPCCGSRWGWSAPTARGGSAGGAGCTWEGRSSLGRARVFRVIPRLSSARHDWLAGGPVGRTPAPPGGRAHQAAPCPPPRRLAPPRGAPPPAAPGAPPQPVVTILEDPQNLNETPHSPHEGPLLPCATPPTCPPGWHRPRPQPRTYGRQPAAPPDARAAPDPVMKIVRVSGRCRRCVRRSTRPASRMRRDRGGARWWLGLRSTAPSMAPLLPSKEMLPGGTATRTGQNQHPRSRSSSVPALTTLLCSLLRSFSSYSKEQRSVVSESGARARMLRPSRAGCAGRFRMRGTA